MKKFLLALVSVGAMAAAAPANAALTDYAFSGALTDGTKFNGAFAIDDAKTSIQQFNNFYVNVGGAKLSNLFTAGTDRSSYYYVGATSNGTSFVLGLNAKSDQFGKVIDLQLGALNSEQTYLYKNRVSTYGSGTISLANTAAVPEPATWALMILGFGAVGYAMRRRRKVEVRFA